MSCFYHAVFELIFERYLIYHIQMSPVTVLHCTSLQQIYWWKKRRRHCKPWMKSLIQKEHFLSCKLARSQPQTGLSVKGAEGSWKWRLPDRAFPLHPKSCAVFLFWIVLVSHRLQEESRSVFSASLSSLPHSTVVAVSNVFCHYQHATSSALLVK